MKFPFRIPSSAFRIIFALAVSGLLLLPAAVSVFRTGSMMHESDQASLVLGALRLARGEVSWIHPGLYEYGNYFLSYWMLAALFLLIPYADPVLAGNILSLVVFWLGAGGLLWTVRRKMPPARIIAVVAALSAPAILVHLPYLAPNFLSAGLLFAGAGLLRLPGNRFSVAALFWLGAFACRMDAVLLIPLLAWISSVRPSLRTVIQSRRSWTLAASGLFMFAVGRILSGLAPAVVYRPFFIPEIYFAFLLFGAGSAFFLGLLLVHMLIRESCRQSETDRRFFWLAAVPALLLPFVFYSALMFSTRHWTVFIVGLLLMVCASHTDACWQNSPVRSGILFLSALIPLFLGIHLPFPDRPALTMTSPTLFPTTDGRCPMGAVVPFLFSGRRTDHNQQTWKAARSVSHWEEKDGQVPLGSFQLFDIVRLAVFLNGQQTNERGTDLSNSPFFYFSSRALLKPEVRLDRKKIIQSQPDLEKLTLNEVSGEFPVAIVQIVPRQALPPSSRSALEKKIAFLQRMFRGNEIEWIGPVPAGNLRLPACCQGRPVVFFSDQPFTASAPRERIESGFMPLDGDNGFFYALIPAVREKNAPVDLSGPVQACTTVYPAYMSLEILVAEPGRSQRPCQTEAACSSE